MATPRSCLDDRSAGEKKKKGKKGGRTAGKGKAAPAPAR